MLSFQPIPRPIRRLRRAALRAFWHALHPLRLVTLWRRRYQGRAWLAAMDDRMLRDIGVSRADVWAEWHKPFWRG